MRAAIWDGPGHRLRVASVQLAPPGAREVLVRIRSSGVCHSDQHVVSGEWRRPVPVVLGHETAGIVEQVGAEVTTVAPGDHVVLSWVPGCGMCDYCAAGRPALCERGGAADGPPGAPGTRLRSAGTAVHSGAGIGGFAEYTVVHETSAIAIRRDVPFEVAAIVGCAVMTGVGAVINTAAARPGQSILVIGCGGVGLAAVLGGRLISAGKIIAADVRDEKLALARRLGATAVVNSAATSLVDAVHELTGGRGVDFAIEAIGTAPTIEQAYEATAPGGTTVVVGQVPDGVKIAIDPYVLSDREKVLKGSNYGSARPRIDFPLLLDLYADGRLDLDPLIGRRIGLEQVDEALAALETGRGTRTVIVFDDRDHDRDRGRSANDGSALGESPR